MAERDGRTFCPTLPGVLGAAANVWAVLDTQGDKQMPRGSGEVGLTLNLLPQGLTFFDIFLVGFPTKNDQHPKV